MRQLYLLESLCIVSSVWIATFQPTQAQTASSHFKEALSPIASSNISHLNQLDRPATSIAEWLSQSPISNSPSLIQITDVQLNPTQAGLELILNTPNGQLPLVSPSVDGNALIAEIPNAVLVLPKDGEFQAANPTDDVALVTVSNLPNNRVRVAITGLNAAPTANVRADATRLVFAVKPAIAADSPVNEEIEVVVTAQRTEEDVQDVPISIRVLTKEEIEDADIITLEDIAQSTPNFSVFNATGNRYFNYYSIRGLSNNNFASRDAVGFYVDDVPYDYGGFITQDFTDIERVEVLRGPQSTLYGRSAQAGAVNIITRRPTNEFELNGTVGYGTYNDLDLRASVGEPLVEDRLFYRLAGSYGSADGYFNNIFLDDRLDERSGGNGRGQLLWTPSEDWEILFNASVDDYRDGGAPIVAVDADPFEIEQDVTGFANLNSNAQSLRIAYDNSNFRATSITSRRFSRQDTETDLDFSPIRTGRFTNVFDSTIITQELRLQSPEDADRFQWLVGGYFESRSFNTADDGFNFDDEAASIFGDFAIPGGSLLRSANLDETLWAGFGQVSYRPLEALTLTAGLRYESINSTLDDFERVLTLPDGSTTTLLAFNDVKQDGDILLPRFAVEYRLNPALMVYGSIARGYRPGGVNYRPDNEASLTFEPERSWNYELGLKSSWFGDRLEFNFAFFHNPVEDYQVIISDPLTALPLEIANANAELTGFELELRATPLDGFDLTAGLGFVDARFTDYQNRATGEAFDGNQLPFAPKWTYNLALQYRAPKGLFARAELVGYGSTFYDESNTLEQGAFVVINVRLGYEFENYGIYLFGNNIFDREYLTAAFGLSGSTTGQYGTSATYGIQFRAQF